MLLTFQKIIWAFLSFTMLSILPTFAQTQPTILIRTSFHHWNHHWFLWTPKHPIYESIEVMTQDSPDNSNHKLVWAFFTERAGKKKQVHYFNDPEVAKNWSGEAYFREIEYKADGRFGGPLNLSIKFKDKDDKLTEWQALFDHNQTLTDGGLTDQSGHSSASFFLIFFREKNIKTTNSKLSIGGEDFSFEEIPGDRRYRFQCAYSFNIYTAIIEYGDVKTEYRPGTIKDSTGRVFKLAADQKVYHSDSFGYQQSIELIAKDGQANSYRHKNQENVFKVDFEPALPSFKSAFVNKRVNYKISIDNFKNLITGVLLIKKTGNAITYDWQHQSPEWAKNYGFTSSVKCDGNTCQTIVRPNR